MANKPILHRRDHERGGADPIRLLWDDGSDGGEGGVGVNDASIHATWTWLGGIFAIDTTIADTLENGTSPGFWDGSSGTDMFCLLEGSWQIEVAGTVTHSSTTAPTIVRFLINGTDPTDIFSVDMADTDTASLSYTTSGTFVVDDSVRLTVTHAVGSGTPSSTMTGTMTFTLL